MIPAKFDYVAPTSVEDAIAELTVLANGDNNPYTVTLVSIDPVTGVPQSDGKTQ